MNYAIEINNISKSYGAVKALNDISLKVKPGEIFGLIGPDGAGKTTLIRILTTLLLPDSGEAHVDSYHVVKEFKTIRNKVGYMPGRFSLYQDLTIEENLNLFATIFGTTVEANYELIKDIYVQIEPFKKRRAGKLSGGMKQKLALSCALIHKPDILFLDEPSTGVDPVSRKELWAMLKKLKSQGITIFASTPYMDEADLCDRVALIQDGNILAVDTPQNVTKLFSAKLYGVHCAGLYKALLDLRHFEHSASVFTFGEILHYSDKRGAIDIKELETYLIEKGNTEVYVKEISPNIEDAFMYLMKSEDTEVLS